MWLRPGYSLMAIITTKSLFHLKFKVPIRRGTLGCIRNRKTEEKKSSKTAKPQKNSAKTENRIQNRQKTDTTVTSGAYRANYTNTLFHQSIYECHGLYFCRSLEYGLYGLISRLYFHVTSPGIDLPSASFHV